MENFESLFRMHHKALCNLAYNIVADKDAAKDIVQEVFYKLWKNREAVEFGDRMKHYLFRATSHTALNYIRSNRKMLRVEDPSDLEHHSLAPAGDELVSFKELELRVRSAIEKLPPKCKMVYLLSRHEGLKYQEIADTLNISLKTVENQMGIALQKLRDELKPFLTPELIVLIILSGFLLALFF